MAEVKIIIEMRGGVIVGVHSTDPEVVVEIKDWDEVHAKSSSFEKELEQGKQFEILANSLHQIL